MAKNSQLWCMWNMAILVLNLVALFFGIRYVVVKYHDFERHSSEPDYYTFRRHRYLLASLLLFGGTIITARYFVPDNGVFHDDGSLGVLTAVFGMVISFIISLVWAVFVRKLDAFETESWLPIIAVFLMSCVSLFLVFPMSNAINGFGFDLNGEVWNDFLYCCIGIGAVEELVKLIPLLIIIRFKKIVNEPFDYIVYASVSALGFAFVENTLYIQSSELYAINGRALMASVAHMTFTSTIGYSLMIARYSKLPFKRWYVLGGFVLASAMHGFYDFWLINPTAQSYAALSLLFFLLTIHFWFTLKQKAINASFFFDEAFEWNNDRLQYFLIVSLLCIWSVSVIAVGLFHGSQNAIDFAYSQAFSYGFLIFYLAFKLTRYKLAPTRFGQVGQRLFESVIPPEPEIQERETE